MTYHILGISLYKDVFHNTGAAVTTGSGAPIYRLFVAWQSNQPGFSFSWRCTGKYIQHFPPTEEDFQDAAARGTDSPKNTATTLFPFLPPKAWSD